MYNISWSSPFVRLFKLLFSPLNRLLNFSLLPHTTISHCVNSASIWSFSGPYFPAFGLNTNRYCVSVRIKFECGKIRTRKTPNTDTLYAVLHAAVFLASLFVLRAGTILLSSFTLLSNLSGSYRSDITTKLLLLGFYCSAILV